MTSCLCISQKLHILKSLPQTKSVHHIPLGTMSKNKTGVLFIDGIIPTKDFKARHLDAMWVLVHGHCLLDRFIIRDAHGQESTRVEANDVAMLLVEVFQANRDVSCQAISITNKRQGSPWTRREVGRINPDLFLVPKQENYDEKYNQLYPNSHVFSV